MRRVNVPVFSFWVEADSTMPPFDTAMRVTEATFFVNAPFGTSIPICPSRSIFERSDCGTDTAAWLGRAVEPSDLLPNEVSPVEAWNPPRAGASTLVPGAGATPWSEVADGAVKARLCPGAAAGSALLRFWVRKPTPPASTRRITTAAATPPQFRPRRGRRRGVDPARPPPAAAASSACSSPSTSAAISASAAASRSSSSSCRNWMSEFMRRPPWRAPCLEPAGSKPPGAARGSRVGVRCPGCTATDPPLPGS